MIRYVLDKLAGNYRTIKEENQLWKSIHHKRHWARVKRADNWFRGKDDKDGKLHALKNYWVEYVRICGRTVAEGAIFVLVAAGILAILR